MSTHVALLRAGSVKDGSANYYVSATQDVKILCEDVQRYNVEDVYMLSPFPFESADLWEKIAHYRLGTKLRGSWFRLSNDQLEDLVQFLSYFSINPISRILLDFASQIAIKMRKPLGEILECAGALVVSSPTGASIPTGASVTGPAGAPGATGPAGAPPVSIECHALNHPPAGARPTRDQVSTAHMNAGILRPPCLSDYNNRQLCLLFEEVKAFTYLKQEMFIRMYGLSDDTFSGWKDVSLKGRVEYNPAIRGALMDF